VSVTGITFHIGKAARGVGLIMTCKARRCNDEMHCHRCGFAWDVKDPEPPKCLTPNQLGLRKLRAMQVEWFPVLKN